MIVEIETDEGLVGWGEAYGPAKINAAVVDHIRPLLIGQDRRGPGGVGREFYARFRAHGQKGVIFQALSAIDIALWDLRGKITGQPIHRLMGGPVRSEVPAYATGLYRRETGNPSGYL